MVGIKGPYPSIKIKKLLEELKSPVVQPVALRLEEGAAISAFADGSTDGWAQISNKELMLRWNNGDTTPTKMAAVFLLPDDLDTSQDLTVHFLAATSGANDIPTIQVEAYLSGIGGAPAGDSDCGGYTSGEPSVASDNYVERTFTIAAADLISGEAMLTVIFNPTSGEYPTDDVISSPPWITFERL